LSVGTPALEDKGPFSYGSSLFQALTQELPPSFGSRVRGCALRRVLLLCKFDLATPFFFSFFFFFFHLFVDGSFLPSSTPSVGGQSPPFKAVRLLRGDFLGISRSRVPPPVRGAPVFVSKHPLCPLGGRFFFKCGPLETGPRVYYLCPAIGTKFLIFDPFL